MWLTRLLYTAISLYCLLLQVTVTTRLHSYCWCNTTSLVATITLLLHSAVLHIVLLLLHHFWYYCCNDVIIVICCYIFSCTTSISRIIITIIAITLFISRMYSCFYPVCILACMFCSSPNCFAWRGNLGALSRGQHGWPTYWACSMVPQLSTAG